MNAWTSGLFDCFDDCGICCYGFCCASCLYGENAKQIDDSDCCVSCFSWFLMGQFGLCCLLHMGKRETLRHRFGLREDCNDCVVTTFCAECAICQEARELKARLIPSPEGVIVTQPMIGDKAKGFGQAETMNLENK